MLFCSVLLRQCLTDCLGLTIEPSVLLPQPPEGWGCKHGRRRCLVMLSSGGRWHLWGRETPSPSGLSQSHLGCETVLVRFLEPLWLTPGFGLKRSGPAPFGSEHWSAVRIPSLISAELIQEGGHAC